MKQIEGQIDIFGHVTEKKVPIDWAIEAIDKYSHVKRAIIKAVSFEQACYLFKKQYGWYWKCYPWY